MFCLSLDIQLILEKNIFLQVFCKILFVAYFIRIESPDSLADQCSIKDDVGWVKEKKIFQTIIHMLKVEQHQCAKLLSLIVYRVVRVARRTPP